MSFLVRLAQAREAGDPGRLAEAMPYARWMNIAPENSTGELLTRMRFDPKIIGNTFLPAIHGGTIGALLESAAIFHLLWSSDSVTIPLSDNAPYASSGVGASTCPSTTRPLVRIIPRNRYRTIGQSLAVGRRGRGPGGNPRGYVSSILLRKSGESPRGKEWPRPGTPRAERISQL